MPFESNLSNPSLIAKIDNFLESTDIVDYYKKYGWKKDLWTKGFPDIFRLEIMIGEAIRTNTLEQNHILKIAKWGGNNNPIKCNDSINVPIYNGDDIAKWVELKPEAYIDDICDSIRYFGPTYGSKLLRFALPSEYGAIDTRIVRVFGKGDEKSSQVDLLNLKVNSTPEKRWYINKYQPNWPAEYGKWINILRHISKQMNKNDLPCPHPHNFIDAKLRESGNWFCADVEMALFSYATHCIYSKE
ncbi:MAG: hypothetical protein PWQ51_2490 [Methanolobus sp.]|nr:hypothetical protein [Methanolobus sp.]